MLVLSDSDKLSPTWLKLKAHYGAQLATLKTQLPQMIAKGWKEDAIAMAARILVIQDLLALGTDDEAVP